MKVLVTKEQYSKLNLTPQSDIGEQDDVEG